ncbi:MAG: peptidoglycan-binding protein [Gemmobacter sp.]|jgi:peptidoglycan hydrolase-like protein with peptidoglycan-binding domain|nr:peptidoglycan-binding protein [Gemmobacter sp.]
MKIGTIATTCAIAAAVAFAPAGPVRADAGDAIAGALIGGIIGHAIAKDQQNRKAAAAAPRKSSKSSATAASGISAAQREQNREVQTALNHFGFPVGTPDGSFGPKSRGAISSYQALLGYPPTGQLTEYERTLLVTAYHRAIAGGPAVAQVVSGHPMGMKGLLLVQRDEMAGVTAASSGQAMGAGLPALVAEPAPSPAPALPSFGGALVSLSSHCNAVALKTGANGGYATLASMGDPAQALSEQFCLSRAVAIQSGEEMVRAVQGVTPQQVAEQCRAFGPVLKEYVTATSLEPAPSVLAGVSQFITESGMSPAQLSGSSKICLGVGYASDDMEVAMGSALVLSALGETGYAALLGHHLADGMGATRRPDLALGWFEIGQGEPVLTGGAPDLVQKAIFMLNGRSEVPAVETPLPVLTPAAPVPQVVVEAAPVPTAPPVVEAQPAATPVSVEPAVAAQAIAIMTALPKLMLGQ